MATKKSPTPAQGHPTPAPPGQDVPRAQPAKASAHAAQAVVSALFQAGVLLPAQSASSSTVQDFTAALLDQGWTPPPSSGASDDGVLPPPGPQGRAGAVPSPSPSAVPVAATDFSGWLDRLGTEAGAGGARDLTALSALLARVRELRHYYENNRRLDAPAARDALQATLDRVSDWVLEIAQAVGFGQLDPDDLGPLVRAVEADHESSETLAVILRVLDFAQGTPDTKVVAAIEAAVEDAESAAMYRADLRRASEAFNRLRTALGLTNATTPEELVDAVRARGQASDVGALWDLGLSWGLNGLHKSEGDRGLVDAISGFGRRIKRLARDLGVEDGASWDPRTEMGRVEVEARRLKAFEDAVIRLTERPLPF